MILEKIKFLKAMFTCLLSKKGFSILFFNKTYQDFLKDQKSNIVNISKSSPDLIQLIEYLRKNMTTFPEDVLLFITQKYIFLTPYLNEITQFNDIFSSLLRVEFLNLLTAFIETLLIKTSAKNRCFFNEINK